MSVRAMRESDLEQVAELAVQLGYSVEAAPLLENFRAARDFPGQGLFVLELDGAVRGWIHAQRRPSLLSPPSVEIAALVVDAAHRGQGLGRELMAAAEAWTRTQGCSEAQLRSRIQREDAHRFYEGLGYERLKTSHTFRRKLA
jgi:GNAT superfamily N-acetyltransferase